MQPGLSRYAWVWARGRPRRDCLSIRSGRLGRSMDCPPRPSRWPRTHTGRGSKAVGSACADVIWQTWPGARPRSAVDESAGSCRRAGSAGDARAGSCRRAGSAGDGQAGSCGRAGSAGDARAGSCRRPGSVGSRQPGSARRRCARAGLRAEVWTQASGDQWPAARSSRQAGARGVRDHMIERGGRARRPVRRACLRADRVRATPALTTLAVCTASSAAERSGRSGRGRARVAEKIGRSGRGRARVAEKIGRSGRGRSRVAEKIDRSGRARSRVAEKIGRSGTDRSRVAEDIGRARTARPRVSHRTS